MQFKDYETVVRSLPQEWIPGDARETIMEHVKRSGKKIVVLDDDPTGVQTVHGIDVWTIWDKASMREAFHNQDPLFFILTNTRSFPASEAERINREIIRTIAEVSAETGTDFSIVSRSDSTLRGHYPLEIDAIADELFSRRRIVFDGQLIVPAFFEGHRHTTGNVHYLREGPSLIPVHLTEFAKDRTFGFSHSNLCEWVEEKTTGRIKAEDCLAISTEQLREGPDAVVQILQRAHEMTAVIANAMTYRDMDALSLALWQAEAAGKRFIYRTGASFVKSYAGIPDQAILAPDRMMARDAKNSGGLVVVGSYVQKSTDQLRHLLEHTNIHAVELIVEELLHERDGAAQIAAKAEVINTRLAAGDHVVLFTSRRLIAIGNKEEQLQTGRRVSDALSSIVRSLRIAPRFLIAKGGITSSDVATKGLGVRKARVLGQAAPGIPVWLTGAESLFPGMPYIVFPGNVGNQAALAEIALSLMA